MVISWCRKETGNSSVATCTNEHLFRGHLTQPLCWVDAQWQRDPPKDHNASRLGAAQRWGPDKVGVRTVQHFNRPEDPNRFVNTDLYRRQNANRYGAVHQKYGRPGEGYYLMRNPSKFIDLFNLSSLLKCSNIREII